MAVPAYTEDLTDISLMESGETGVVALNISGGGGGAPAFGADFSIQGAGCWDKAASNAERAIAINKTPGAGTVAAGVHIFQWGLVGTPGVTDTLALRGVYVLAGTSTSDFTQFHVEGSDTFGAQGRVGKCYPFRYNTTANTGSSPYRTLQGTPGATPTYFGYGLKTVSTVKSSNFGMDAVRYGTGAYLTAGELIAAGDASDDPCTFVDFNTQNDALANRWGILTSIGGTNYELQGRFVIGQDNTKTATLCRFKDSDINISIVDTVHTETDFTQIIIDHASTRAELININITALGTNNKGSVIVNSANPTVLITGGTWQDIDATLFRSNTTVSGLTSRNTGIVTQNGATISDTVFAGTTATHHVLSDNPSLIEDCTFISNGTGHAVRCDTVGTYDWTGNVDSGYSGTPGSNPTPSSGTANDMFYNNSGGLITLNVAGGATTPSVRNGAGATTVVVAGSVTVTANAALKDGTAVESARVYLRASNGTGPFPYLDSVTITRSGTTATVAHTAHGMDSGDKVTLLGITDKIEDRGIHTITVTGANAYTYTTTDSGSTSYTGTIRSTFVALSGVTDVTGALSVSRVYPSNQPVTGWTRKSSGSPFLQEGVLVGTINSSTGFNGTAVMITDE